MVPIEEREPAPKRGRMGPAKVAGWALCAAVAAFGLGAVALDAQPGTAAAESQQQAQVQDRQQGQADGSQQEERSDDGEASGDAEQADGGSASGEGKATSEKAASASGSKSSGASSSSSGSQKADAGSSGSSSSPSSSEPAASKPAHQHSWKAQYKTVHHDAQYKTVVVCLTCGAIDPGLEHMKQHAKNGENGATTVKRIKIKDAWSEKVLTGYKCSCGATK